MRFSDLAGHYLAMNTPTNSSTVTPLGSLKPTESVRGLLQLLMPHTPVTSDNSYVRSMACQGHRLLPPQDAYLCNVTLPLLPVRGRIHFSTPFIWAGLVICFDQYHFAGSAAV